MHHPVKISALILLFKTSFACDISHLARRDSGSSSWSYDTPTHWADDQLNILCHNGMHQSPIALTSQTMGGPHIPSFIYEGDWNGELSNTGHGIKFVIDRPEGDNTALPSLTFDDQTVYLDSWHTHIPAEHVIDGDRSTGEMHFVHVDAEGNPKAVVAFRLDPSSGSRNVTSTFFEQIGEFPDSNEHGTHKRDVKDCKPSLALHEVAEYHSYWSYSGSLTTPPCSEGLRWFVARDVLVLGDEQLQALVNVSQYSARPTQHPWLHGVGK